MAREKAGNEIKGANRATDIAYNDAAGAAKVIGPLQGVLKILGALNAGVQVPQKGATMAVFNNSAAVAFVALGAQTASAPSSPANGIPIPPYSYIYVCMGINQFIISNVATVFGYQVIDETYLTPNSQGYAPTNVGGAPFNSNVPYQGGGSSSTQY